MQVYFNKIIFMYNITNFIAGHEHNLEKAFYIKGFEVVTLGKYVDFHRYTLRKLVLFNICVYEL